MIVLDTNVISEVMRVKVAPDVRDWLNRQPGDILFITAITVAELTFGQAVLPAGRRKRELTGWCDRILQLFTGRILPIDEHAGRRYGQIAAQARAAGRPLPMPDGYIAAVASVHGFAVATRDTAPFEAAGLRTINPWLTANI